MEKITLDDVFIALKKISKDLPKRKTITKKINNTNFNDIINYPLVINSNIPPYNQSAMDGIAVKSKELNYRIKGKTYLNKLNNIKISNKECLIVKTGSLIPDEINFIIPIERIFRNKNTYHVYNYNFKNKFIRLKGHIFKKNHKIKLSNNFCLKNFMAIRSINNLNVNLQSKLKFKIISTGSEFTNTHFIRPSNAEYIKSIILKYGQLVENCVHVIDDQKIILNEIKKTKSDITIIIGGTGKSEDDINFNRFKLKIDGLDLKPGRPFKYFFRNDRLFLFFPGNPCSSFVLTNFLIKSLINKYCYNKFLEPNMIMNIKNIKYNFNKLTRKTFLFGFLQNKNIKVFKNQESSNFSNILYSNCLIYYDKTKDLKVFKLND